MNSIENRYCSAFSWSGVARVLVFQDSVVKQEMDGRDTGTPPQWEGSHSLTQAVRSSTPSGLSDCGYGDLITTYFFSSIHGRLTS